MTVEDFSNKINCTRRNAYKIFDKPSIDTDLLVTISKVIGENLFFKYIKDEEIAKYTNDKVKQSQLLDAFKNLEETVLAMGKQKNIKKTALKKKTLKVSKK